MAAAIATMAAAVNRAVQETEGTMTAQETTAAAGAQETTVVQEAGETTTADADLRMTTAAATMRPEGDPCRPSEEDRITIPADAICRRTDGPRKQPCLPA